MSSNIKIIFPWAQKINKMAFFPAKNSLARNDCGRNVSWHHTADQGRYTADRREIWVSYCHSPARKLATSHKNSKKSKFRNFSIGIKGQQFMFSANISKEYLNWTIERKILIQSKESTEKSELLWKSWLRYSNNNVFFCTVPIFLFQVKIS